jgi:hypothetical protein
LLINLGLVYYRRGYYSRALQAWSSACAVAMTITDPAQRPLADRAIGELAYLLAKVGRVGELDTLLTAVADRGFCGPATEKIAAARAGLFEMRARPEVSFRCGPLALHRIMLAAHPENPRSGLIHASESTDRGFSLHQLEELSQRLGLHYRPAFRESGADLVVGSVVHLTLDHFAAVIRREGDRYLLEDPTFKNDAWVTAAALDAEASGYFLIPPGDLPNGWRPSRLRRPGASGEEETCPTRRHRRDPAIPTPVSAATPVPAAEEAMEMAAVDALYPWVWPCRASSCWTSA